MGTGNDNDGSCCFGGKGIYFLIVFKYATNSSNICVRMGTWPPLEGANRNILSPPLEVGKGLLLLTSFEVAKGSYCTNVVGEIADDADGTSLMRNDVVRYYSRSFSLGILATIGFIFGVV